MDNEQNERSVSFSDLWDVFRLHWILLLAVLVVVAAVTLGVAYLTYEEQYTASSTFFVIREQGSGTSGSYSSTDYSMDLKITGDIKELLSTDSYYVYEQVSARLKTEEGYTGNTSVGFLRKNIKVKTVSETRFVKVDVTCDTWENAQIASAVVNEVLVQTIKDSLKAPNYEVTVNQLDLAVGTKSPSNKRFKIVYAAIPVGATVIVYAVMLIIYISNDKIRNADDVEKHLGLSTFGIVPNLDDAKRSKNRYYKGHYGRYGEYGAPKETAGNGGVGQ